MATIKHRPLHEAVVKSKKFEDSKATLTTLLVAGFSPVEEDERGQTPLSLALSLGKKEIADFFLEIIDQNNLRLDPESQKHFKKQVFKAVFDDNVGEVEELLQCGVDPNIKDENGYTLLCAALHWKKSRNMILTLLSHNADPNIPYEHKKKWYQRLSKTKKDYPLDIAAENYPKRDVPELLVKHHAHTDHATHQWWHAKEHGNDDTAKYLETFISAPKLAWLKAQYLLRKKGSGPKH